MPLGDRAEVSRAQRMVVIDGARPLMRVPPNRNHDDRGGVTPRWDGGCGDGQGQGRSVTRASEGEACAVLLCARQYQRAVVYGQ